MNRKIGELLKVMLENKQYFEKGLCLWVHNLLINVLITEIEYRLLRNYIDTNKPSKFSSFSAFFNCDPLYYWRKGEIKPRIRWLKKHIRRNS